MSPSTLLACLPVCVSPVQAINPVVLGLARAEQTALHRSGAVRSAEEAWRRVMPLQIHGDAAFSGLGIVLESLQLADLPGFKVGGSVHVIINNQVGVDAVRLQCACWGACGCWGSPVLSAQ